MKVMVGLTSSKAGKPSAESVVKGNVRLEGGLPLPNPSAASAGKIWTVLVPEISMRSAPQVPVVPPKVPRESSRVAYRGSSGHGDDACSIHAVSRSRLQTRIAGHGQFKGVILR